MPEVSVVIVSMNNLNNLNICLNSIYKYTHVDFEIIVVAYLFSKENLITLKKKFPYVQVIESSKIRGFSENNNLALRIAKGKYCFVLNDDTEFHMPVLDPLIHDMNILPDNVAVVSPVLKYPNGKIQCCGRPIRGLKEFVLFQFRIWNEKKVRNKYTYQTGLFQTYNLVGAAFLIKRSIFETIGFFDEYYFFCPEDIAVSTTLNNKGYKCYVDSNVYLTHKEGDSGGLHISKIHQATEPAALKGSIHFYSHGNFVLYFLLSSLCLFSQLSIYLKHFFYFYEDEEKRRIVLKSSFNSVCSLFFRESPKDTFIRFYKKIS
jgi:N-acetylglucosaminyl-diphospho-decaprenol L-rhamnosyltransferase